MLDIETIKNARAMTKEYVHLAQYALDNNCSITVTCGDEIVCKKSKDLKEIRESMECADETHAFIYNQENKRVGWAWVIPYNDDNESVADLTITDFMNNWTEEYKKFCKQLGIE